MNWDSLKKRIRRFLRDPDGNIWDDATLLRLWNDEQSDICMKAGLLERIQALRVPPMYQQSYQWDWEWRYTESTGKRYQCHRYHQQLLPIRRPQTLRLPARSVHCLKRSHHRQNLRT